MSLQIKAVFQKKAGAYAPTQGAFVKAAGAYQATVGSASTVFSVVFNLPKNSQYLGAL